MKNAIVRVALICLTMLAANVYAVQVATAPLHSAMIDDNGDLLTKGSNSWKALGHTIEDGEYHEASLVDSRYPNQALQAATAIQVDVSYKSTAVRVSDGTVAVIGGNFSAYAGQVNVIAGRLVNFEDFAFQGTVYVLLLGDDGHVYKYDSGARTLRDLNLQGSMSNELITDISGTWSDALLVLTADSGATYTISHSNIVLPLADAPVSIPAPVITDVQPGGSYLISCENCGDAEGTVTMDGFVFDVKTWGDSSVHIENPPTQMTGDLIVTSNDGLSSNAYYVTLEPDAPAETPIEVAEVCPVVEPEIEYVTEELTVLEQVGNVEDAGYIVLAEMPALVIVEKIVEVEVIVEVEKIVEVEVIVYRDAPKACKPGKGHGDKNHCHEHKKDKKDKK